ncbi:cold-shock protein [Aneurinibacillus uraniidurans]|uniref:cold-shock protein n=1 Tax=Aneurinibacillus uraniidurans TaxID=2966586 RepID=UPI003BEED6E2
MAFMRARQQLEEVPLFEIVVWSCENESCNGWMRQDYSFIAQPDCPLCQSRMNMENRMLPQLSHYAGP